jgi:hypothetical protein
MGEGRSLPLFLQSVKASMAQEWNEGLVKPAYEFYEVASDAWDLKIMDGYTAVIEYMLNRMYSTW